MIEYLDWDSDLFLKKVGRVNLNDPSEIDSVLEKARSQSFNVLYVFSNDALSHCDVSLYEERFIFQSTSPFWADLDHDYDFVLTTVFESKKKMLDLIYESGSSSRFKLDPHFSTENFEKMYEIWFEKSLVNKNVLCLIDSMKRELAGILCYSTLNDFGKLELISVSDEFRGRGVGKILVGELHKIYNKCNVQLGQVVTQGQNLPAINLYKACGYRLIRQQHLYHFWL